MKLTNFSTLALADSYHQSIDKQRAYQQVSDRLGHKTDNTNFSKFIVNLIEDYEQEINYRLYGELLPSGD